MLNYMNAGRGEKRNRSRRSRHTPVGGSMAFGIAGCTESGDGGGTERATDSRTDADGTVGDGAAGGDDSSDGGVVIDNTSIK